MGKDVKIFFTPINKWINCHLSAEEDCSTNDIMDDEDALLCPHGYICHIEDPGNPSQGIPNRGTCIKERNRSQNHRGRRFRLKNLSLQKGVCVFENAIFVDGATFLYERHPW